MKITESEAFEGWFKTTEMYKVLEEYIATHQPNLSSPLVKSGKSYRNSMVQASWLGWQEKAKTHTVPEGYVLFPKVATKEIDEILGMQCFQFIRTAQIYRELGFEINKKAESEQAFFLFKFLHLALVHGEKYLDVFNAETRKLILANESGAEG